MQLGNEDKVGEKKRKMTSVLKNIKNRVFIPGLSSRGVRGRGSQDNTGRSLQACEEKSEKGSLRTKIHRCKIIGPKPDRC